MFRSPLEVYDVFPSQNRHDAMAGGAARAPSVPPVTCGGPCHPPRITHGQSALYCPTIDSNRIFLFLSRRSHMNPPSIPSLPAGRIEGSIRIFQFIHGSHPSFPLNPSYSSWWVLGTPPTIKHIRPVIRRSSCIFQHRSHATIFVSNSVHHP